MVVFFMSVIRTQSTPLKPEQIYMLGGALRQHLVSLALCLPSL